MLPALKINGERRIREERRVHLELPSVVASALPTASLEELWCRRHHHQTSCMEDKFLGEEEPGGKRAHPWKSAESFSLSKLQEAAVDLPTIWLA